MRKGFTLVELLAVVVILALLLVIGIPFSTRVINNARKAGFVKMADKLYTSTLNTYETDLGNDPSLITRCKVYSIKDIGLDDTGNFYGYTIVKSSLDKRQVYITVRDNKNYLKFYDYSTNDAINQVEKYVSNDYNDDFRSFLTEIGCYRTDYSESFGSREETAQ